MNEQKFYLEDVLQKLTTAENLLKIFMDFSNDLPAQTGDVETDCARATLFTKACETYFTAIDTAFGIISNVSNDIEKQIVT